MIKYNLIISLFLLLGCIQVHAQLNINGANSTFRNIKNMQYEMYSNGINPSGNASLEDYYEQEWQAASILFKDKISHQYDKVRYNLDTKVLELQIGNKIYFISAKEVDKLIFTELNKTFISKKENSKLGLLEVVTENKNILFLTAYGIDKPNKNSDIYAISNSKIESKKTEQYYLLRPDEDLFRLSRNKKKNAKFFAVHWVEVESFIKKNKLSVKKKNDVMKIIDFYAGLN